MKATKNKDVLPLSLRRGIAKLGADISIARRKRSLTVGLMAERIGVHKNTYLKVEKGDPTVSFGIYAMALFVLGLSNALTAVADPGRDDNGLLLDADHLPKRVRAPKGLSTEAHDRRLLSDASRRTGTLRFDSQGARQSAAFEYTAVACRFRSIY